MTVEQETGAPNAAETRLNKATEEKKTVEDESKAYNPPLLFLAGLLTFCLGIIAAIFSAIDKTSSAHFKFLGPLLAWTAVTAVVATLSVAVLQYKRSKGGKTKPEPVVVRIALIVPLIPGFLMAIACIRLANSIVGEDGVLPSLLFGF